MRSTATNYAGQQQYLLSPGAAAAAAASTTGLAPPRHTQLLQQVQHQQQHQQSRTSNLATPLPMASSNGTAAGIQQQFAPPALAATTTATVAGNYPHPHPQAPPMASNKLNSSQPAAQLAPVSGQVHYHNGGAALGGFKAALRHPQKFIHNLYSGVNTAKSATGQQQVAVAHSKQALRLSDQQQASHQQQKQPAPQQPPQPQPKHRSQVSRFPGEAPAPNEAHHLEPRQEQYASQLRSSPLLHRFQQQHQQQQQQSQQRQLYPASQQMQQRPAGGPLQQPPVVASPSAATSGTLQAPLRSPPGGQRSQQVNFNRATDQPEEAGESRKKKYLTAKYGQQQMSLIKKRLKIEMWLYEQLQELAKSTKSEAELDEIEIDLDQLLDMDDDETRRRWLKKTLEPFEDLQPDRIDKFINDVLDQSKLL